MTTPMVMHLAGAKVLPIHIDYSIMDKIVGQLTFMLMEKKYHLHY